MEKENYFVELNNVNVNDKVEKKNGLTYLSWAYAWGEVKKRYPDSNYIIYERPTDSGPVNYFTDKRTCWVKTGVLINGIEHIEELPVMNNRNQSIPHDAVTSVDVNKTIQRSLTKAIARHGLGLYIYAGEDVPGDENNEEVAEIEKVKEEVKKVSAVTKNVKPAEKVGADAVIPTTTEITAPSEKLTQLIKIIGIYVKKIKIVYGTLEPYQNIILKVTNNPGFKCNIATEEDIPLLEAILTELQQDAKIN